MLRLIPALIVAAELVVVGCAAGSANGEKPDGGADAADGGGDTSDSGTEPDGPDTTTNPCDLAPPDLKSACEAGNRFVDQQLAKWKPTVAKPLDFGAYHVFASDDVFEKSTADVDTRFADVLIETNAKTLVLYIRPGAYRKQQTRYDALISKIRTAGRHLFVGARLDDGALTFGDYGNALRDYTNTIVKNLKPDAFGIVVEPTTMERKHGFDVTDAEWVNLVSEVATLSKSVSPGTRTVAAGHKEELEFLKSAAQVADLDVVGFDIYDRNGIYPEYKGYLGVGDLVGDAIDFVRAAGKEAWILETWSVDCNHNEDVRATCAQEFMKVLDSKWLRMMTYYAIKHDVQFFCPFFTGKFVRYGDDPLPWYSALVSGERTAPFYEFQKLVSEFQP